MPRQRTPLESIRAKCLDCVCGSYRELLLCTIDDCPLYPYLPTKKSSQGNEEGEGTGGESAPPSEETAG